MNIKEQVQHWKQEDELSNKLNEAILDACQVEGDCDTALATEFMDKFLDKWMELANKKEGE